MAYPPGISLAVIQAGRAGTFFGGAASLTATVTPVLGNTKYLVHQATGDILVPSPQVFTAPAESVLSFSIPHVDQSGYLDDNATPYTMWAYKIDITVLIGNGRSVKKHTWTKNFQPLVGQDFIDVDQIASGIISTGVAAPLPEILSVNGQTGHVTVEAGADDGQIAGLVQDPGTFTGAAVETMVDNYTTGKVTGVGVGRIIVSRDPDEPLENGDLLVLLESTAQFTDFSTYATGAPPSDWTRRWVNSGTFTVVDDANATGGKVLRATGTSSGRRGLTWDALNDLAAQHPNVDALFKWRGSADAAAARAMIRASGGAGTETGYTGGHSTVDAAPALYAYINGQNVGHNGPKGTFTANTWYITRLRAQGTTIAVRTWPAGEAEPAAWNVQIEDMGTTSGGWVGVQPFGVGTMDYDWFAAAFDGEPAKAGA